MQQPIYIETVGNYFQQNTDYSAMHLYAQRVLSEFNGGIVPAHDIIQKTCELASKYYNKTITQDMIMERNRRIEVVCTRVVCTVLVLSQNNISLTDAGKLIGGRDHSSIIFARRNFMNGYNAETKTVYSENLYKLFNICSQTIFKKNYEYFQQRLSEIYTDERRFNHSNLYSTQLT